VPELDQISDPAITQKVHSVHNGMPDLLLTVSTLTLPLTAGLWLKIYVRRKAAFIFSFSTRLCMARSKIE
jgi:hypothetical protein